MLRIKPLKSITMERTVGLIALAAQSTNDVTRGAHIKAAALVVTKQTQDP